jgi:anaerobic selenocysteine-containing dehydrogenase
MKRAEIVDYSLDGILDELNRYHQRATYGAVGQLVDRPPSFLMSGRPHDHWHSWVVNQETHLPTGYTEEQMHPELQERQDVIADSEELTHWLRSPG